MAEIHNSKSSNLFFLTILFVAYTYKAMGLFIRYEIFFF